MNDQQWDAEEQLLEEQLESGDLDVVEYNKRLTAINRARREDAIAEAQQAYDDVLTDRYRR